MARHLLVTNDYPPKTGGIQVYLHELWSRLEPDRAVVVTASSHEAAPVFDAASPIAVERIDAATLYLPTPRVRARIEEAIARHRPSLVLLDPAWPLGLIGPTLSVPYGVVLHGAEVTIPGRLPLVASTLRHVLRRASVIVAAGQYCETEARRCVGGDLPPVVQIPPGVDVERFTPLGEGDRRAVRERLGLTGPGPLLASYSRLVPRKGMDTLIRAAAILRRRGFDFTLAVGGSGRDRERLERLAAREGVEVRFMGRIDDEVLPSWLASADVMVMDCRSRWLGLEQEGFGIVFVEAASAGVPAVAGRSGGSHEAVEDGETGLVVERSRSPQALADALEELLVDPALRAEYGTRAREVALERFDWRKLAAELGAGLEPFDGAVTYS